MKKIYLLLCIILVIQLCGCKNDKAENSTQSQSSQKATVTTAPPTTSIPETTTTPITTEKEVVTIPFETVDTQVPLDFKILFIKKIIVFICNFTMSI